VKREKERKNLKRNFLEKGGGGPREKIIRDQLIGRKILASSVGKKRRPSGGKNWGKTGKETINRLGDGPIRKNHADNKPKNANQAGGEKERCERTGEGSTLDRGKRKTREG